MGGGSPNRQLDPDLEELLNGFGLNVTEKTRFENEGITKLTDLALLSVSDLEEMKLPIGIRNRIRQWQVNEDQNDTPENVNLIPGQNQHFIHVEYDDCPPPDCIHTGSDSWCYFFFAIFPCMIVTFLLTFVVFLFFATMFGLFIPWVFTPISEETAGYFTSYSANKSQVPWPGELYSSVLVTVKEANISFPNISFPPALEDNPRVLVFPVVSKGHATVHSPLISQTNWSFAADQPGEYAYGFATSPFSVFSSSFQFDLNSTFEVPVRFLAVSARSLQRWVNKSSLPDSYFISGSSSTLSSSSSFVLKKDRPPLSSVVYFMWFSAAPQQTTAPIVGNFNLLPYQRIFAFNQSACSLSLTSTAQNSCRIAIADFPSGFNSVVAQTDSFTARLVFVKVVIEARTNWYVMVVSLSMFIPLAIFWWIYWGSCQKSMFLWPCRRLQREPPAPQLAV